MKIKKDQPQPRNIEEILEFLISDETLELIPFEKIKEYYGKEANNLIKKMEIQNLITLTDKGVYLTESGREKAKEIIRRHRLAECLLKDVFEVKTGIMETSACEFEHILVKELTESICTFLGHPNKCPHGKPIPPGDCCKHYKLNVSPLIKTIKEMETGSSGQITYITSKAKYTLGRLASMGILPGQKVKLIQKSPSYVILIENTTLALDDSLASQIYVRPSL